MKLKRVGAILAVLTLIAAPIASANELISTDPASGSTITVSPSAVTITTSMPLMADGNSVEVTDPSGNRVDDGTIAIADTEAVVGLTELTVGGYYTVSYTLLAENDVPLTGSYRFNFNAPASVTSESPSPIAVSASTAAPSAGSSKGTDLLVIMLLVISIFVLVGLGVYARKIFNER